MKWTWLVIPNVRWIGCIHPSRSLRELFVIIILVAAISIVVTYHVSKYYLQRQQTQLKIQFNGRVDIFRSFVDSRLENVGSDRHQGLEGIDLEEGLRHNSAALRAPPRGLYGNQNLPPTPLEKKLREIEEKYFRSAPKSAVLCGSASALNKQQRMYRGALDRVVVTLGDQAELKRNLTDNVSCDKKPSEPAVVICLEDGHRNESICIQSAALDKTYRNFNPGLIETLGSKDALCRTMTAAKHLPAVRQNEVVPPCYNLPEQLDSLLNAADERGSREKWIFKPLDSSKPNMLLEPTKTRDFSKIQKLVTGGQRLVVQQYKDHPQLLFGMPFSVTSFVLVTSLSPLRAYMHSQGIVQYRYDYQKNFKKVLGRTWSLEHFKYHLLQTQGKQAAAAAFKNMESAIIETLLVSSTIDSIIGERCEGCFHLLGFDVIFNSTFHPVVTQVDPWPNVQELQRSSEWDDSGSNVVIDDMIAMVTSTVSTASVVARSLEELSPHIGIEGLDCQNYHKLCLSEADLRHLLSSRRETFHRAGFVMLYPSKDSDRFTALIEEIQKYSVQSKTANDKNVDLISRKPSKPHSSGELHLLQLSMERFYYSLEAVDNSYDDLNLPLFQDNLSKNSKPSASSFKLIENVFHAHVEMDKKYVRQSCSEEKDSMPYLSGFFTEPVLNFTPVFNKDVIDYYATVPHNILLIKVWGFAKSCNCEARLDDKYGLSRPSNYTLGVGNNQMNMHVVDVTHTEPWIINTYAIHIYRESLTEKSVSVGDTDALKACYLAQSCNLRLVPSDPCGIQPSKNYSTWSHFLEVRRFLPKCSTGDAAGVWMVGCSNCSETKNCDWKTAVWQPRDCNHITMPRKDLKKCLANKQILFIGDSTNRGIMHYVMEQANETLTEWDKTHNIKVYNNINHDQTTVSFTYYPQFWLPANQRPVFDKALYQLIKKSGPLENNHNTVLVIGGVHWLATHHISVVKKALEREGLDRIRVIIKSLGAGFHQPVDGLHCLSLREQRKLLIHNGGLVDFSKRQNYDVVDTFNMTMARYSEFLQGKCACHFHRVREILPSFTQYMASTGHSGKLVDMPIFYHVEGDINAAYSEILLNRICSDN